MAGVTGKGASGGRGAALSLFRRTEATQCPDSDKIAEEQDQ